MQLKKFRNPKRGRSARLNFLGFFVYNMNKLKITKKDPGYTQIPNEVLKRSDMSMKSKGLLCYLLSLPNDWVLYKTELSSHFKDGKDAITSAFDELVILGYILSEELPREAGKFVGYNYTVSDFPQRNRDGFTAAENPQLLIPNKQININNKKPIKKSKEERALDFKNTIVEYLSKSPSVYEKELLNEFYRYWTESKPNSERLRFESEEFFDMGRRIGTFVKRQTPKFTTSSRYQPQYHGGEVGN